MPEAKRDACGQMMETALRLQTAGEVTEAERWYREVLHSAPNTHDALHMLGAIHLRRGDLFEAEKLIKKALCLRQEYPTIRRNLTLVENAIRAREQRDVQLVCELALPLLADEVLLPSGHAPTAVAAREVRAPAPVTGRCKETHIIGDFGEVTGETEWFSRRIASLLSTRQPTLWSIQKQVDAIAHSQGVHTMSAVDRRLPVGGVQILVGIDRDLEAWIEQAMPERLLVFGLGASPARYLEQLRYLAASGAPPIELVFRSRAEAGRFGRAGPILPPPIELPDKRTSKSPLPPPSGTSFTLGALAREGRTIRPGDDGELLQALAGSMCRLSIFEPGELRYRLGAHPAVEFHSRRERSLQEFLTRIDGLLHRVPEPWEEGCGLALFGAMALGLPVLCSRASLYAEYIEHEVSGLLYSDKTEVVAWVERLAHNAKWARIIGDGARSHAAKLFDPATLSAGYGALLETAPTRPNR